MKDFEILEKNLGLQFKDKDILKQAFTHRSYLNENPDLKLEQNERLEFLGDHILKSILGKYLYKRFSKTRSIIH